MWKTTTYETTKLTLELRDIVDNGEHSIDIWAFDYPSYYKGDAQKEFERKVIEHYYFRQIGQETVGRFLRYFRAKVREIMPYYIELYKTAEIMSNIEDPFGNVDIVETFEQTTTDSTTTETSTSGSTSGTNTTELDSTVTHNSTEDKEHRFSDTPQGTINNLDDHLSEASVDNNILAGNDKTKSTTEGSSSTTDSSSTSGTSTGEGTLRHTFTKKGNQGVNTYAHDMVEFRQTIINIDMMVINELNELFLGVY